MITMTPRFVYKKQKNDLIFHTRLIPKNKISLTLSMPRDVLYVMAIFAQRPHIRHGAIPEKSAGN